MLSHSIPYNYPLGKCSYYYPHFTHVETWGFESIRNVFNLVSGRDLAGRNNNIILAFLPWLWTDPRKQWMYNAWKSTQVENHHYHVAICKHSNNIQHHLCLTLLWYFLIPPDSIIGIWWAYFDDRGNTNLGQLLWFTHVSSITLDTPLWHCQFCENVGNSFTFISPPNEFKETSRA